MSIKNLVEKITAIVGGELRMPNQAIDLPDADRPDGVLAVINAKTHLKVNGILFDLPLH